MTAVVTTPRRRRTPSAGTPAQVVPAPGSPYLPAPRDRSWRTVFEAGDHIRGVVMRPTREPSGKLHYWWEVTNTATGQRITHSDAFDFGDAMTTCAAVVGLARAAWFWSLDHNDLGPRRARTLTLTQADLVSVMTLVTGSQPYKLHELVHRVTTVLDD